MRHFQLRFAFSNFVLRHDFSSQKNGATGRLTHDPEGCYREGLYLPT